MSNIIKAGAWSGNLMNLYIPNDNDLDAMIGYYLKIATKPIYCPLNLIKDSVFIFNHFTDSIMVYNNNGELKRTIPINYHKQNGWQEKIIIDEEGQNAYALFIKKGITYINKISLITGKIIKTNSFNNNSHPKNIKIKNSYIYYLHNEAGSLNTYLYKQLIK